MNEQKEASTGVLVIVIFVILLDALFFYSLSNTLMASNGQFTMFLNLTTDSLFTWISVFLALLSFIIIPYGFFKRKNAARLFAMVFLVFGMFRALLYIVHTGERTIGYGLFALCVITLLYLFTTSVKKYFEKRIMAIVPIEPLNIYTYGLYSLYTELVRLKNGKNQIIYFFSKRTPKSGTPTSLPAGYHVEVSKRSGLPYLKKDPEASPTPS